MFSPTRVAMRSALMSPPRSTLHFTAKSSSISKPSKTLAKELGTDMSGEVGRSLFYDSPQRRVKGVVRGIMSIGSLHRGLRNQDGNASRLQPKRWSPSTLSKASRNRPSLAEFHPGIAGGWVTSSHRLATMHTELPTSQRAVWWRCAHCDATFQRKIAAHVEQNGECPSCGSVPAADQEYPPLPQGLRFRKLSGRRSLWSQNSSRVRKSVVDLQNATTQAHRNGASLSGTNNRVPPISRRNLQPMLAHLWQQYRHTILPTEQLTVSPKLDGVRCIAAWEPITRCVVLLSRHGTVIEACPHINAELSQYFKKDPTLVLDGELYHHTAFETFEELSGLIRRTKSSGLTKLSKSEAAKLRAIQFHVFDVMEGRLKPKRGKAVVNLGDLSFTSRSKFLQVLLGASSRADTFKDFDVPSKQHQTHSIKIVQAIPCSVENVDRYLKVFTNKGYEGVMVRRVDEPYAKGKRSAHLLKYKTMLDDEYRIHGVVEGQGKWKRAIGAFTCRTKSGKLFRASPAVTAIRRRSLWAERNRLIGKMLTVQYQEMSGQGVPRFPVGKAVRGSFANKSDWL